MGRATVTIPDIDVGVDELSSVPIRISVPADTDGIGFLALEVEDPSVCEISGLDLRLRGEGTRHITQNRYATLQWSVDNYYTDGDSTLAQLFVRGVSTGSTSVKITDVRNFRRSSGGSFEVDVTNSSVSVGGGTRQQLSIHEERYEVAAGTQFTTPVVASGSNGIGSIEMNLFYPKGVVTGVSSPASFSDIDVGEQRASLGCIGFGDSRGETVVASVEGSVQSSGRYRIGVEVEAAGDVDANSYDVPDGRKTITISAVDGDGGSPTPEPVAPDVTGDGNPATDPDGDGLYEDVNGDGSFSIVDVSTLLNNLDSDPVQNNSELFDFNGDGQVSITDVSALLGKL